MRIYCAIRHASNPERYYSGLWAANFYPALRRLGHEILESTIDLEPTSAFMEVAKAFTPEEQALRADVTQRIMDEVSALHRRGRIDLFLSYFYNSHFDPAGFECIHALGIPTVNFFCNSVYQFDLVSDIARAVRFSWHPERDARSAYVAAGARPVWVQMGADPDLCRPPSGIRREPALCFVGQRYADRALWLAALARASVPLWIYGQGWAQDCRKPPPADSVDTRLGRRVLRPGTAAAYLGLVKSQILRHGLLGGLHRTLAQARYRLRTHVARRVVAPFVRGYAEGSLTKVFAGFEVILNLSNVWADGQPGSALIPHVRLRDFEVPMSRACLLTGDSSEIRDFYVVGTEIETYRNPAELIDKARFLLRNPSTAERMREAGYRRAVRDHTWDSRFRALLELTCASR